MQNAGQPLVYERVGARTLPRLPLIARPTELHELRGFSTRLKLTTPILVKREDQTSPRYGGNKVRNLEFILADATIRKVPTLKTLLPMGSNFSAALASEANALGLNVELHQFVAETNAQTLAHSAFAGRQGAKIAQFGGLTGLPIALLSYALDSAYPIAPGASSLLGAVGHARAFLEYTEQSREQGRALADQILVATGTCGTLAGLLAGAKLAGAETKFIAVRCAHPLVCNAQKILRLANGCLAFLGSTQSARKTDFRIVEAPGHIAYGVPSARAMSLAKPFVELEGIPLDLTYTSKGVAALETLVREHGLGSRGERLLYWHTYSARAYLPSL